jgi:type II secretory ATPase GspE/PulE/Tfp pilus assembly ATPase PilB-like protein
MSSSPAQKPKASHIIPILPPPLAEIDIKNAVKAGEKIELVLHDGTTLVGTLQRFQRDEKMITVAVDGGAIQDIAFSKFGYLMLPQPRAWAPEQLAPEQAAQPANQGSHILRYHIDLKDGSTLEEVTLGYRSDAGGLYLYPLLPNRRYFHVFVPHSSTERYRLMPAEAPDESPAPEAPLANEADAEAAAALKNLETTEALEVVLRNHKPPPKLRLGEILVKEKLITQQNLDEALEAQKALRAQGKNIQIGQVMMDLGIINMSEIMQALSEKLGIPFIDLGKFKLNPEAIKYIPEDMVRKHNIVPVHCFGNKLVIALENPMDREAIDAVGFHSNLYIEPVMASKEEIAHTITTLYSMPSIDIDSVSLDTFTVGYDDTDKDKEEEYGESSVQDNVIVKLVNKIIIDAYQQGASDIHIEPYPGKKKTIVRIRKDGDLKNYYEIPSKMRSAVIARIKIMADLDISEKRKPQDGKIDFKKFSMLKIELRVATIPTAADMEDVVMRILASGEPVPLEKIGLSERNMTTLKRMISKPYGLIFVCGPTGSGKTTTLHSVLGFLNTPDVKIWTAEDPVEITQRGLRQVEVKPKIGFNFAAAMRSFLRADPDIIMVGEMRDKETTSIGIEASLTGHLVLSTLHTNTAPETVTRLLDMGMDPFNFADALIGILAQRLAKRLCSSCKEKYEPGAEEIRDMVAEYCYELLAPTAPDAEKQALYGAVLKEWREKFSEDGRFALYRPKGCKTCDDSGYKGRLGIHELLYATSSIKKQILEHATVSEMLATALKENMRTLKQDGIEKVLQGLTDLHTVRTVCIK